MLRLRKRAILVLLCLLRSLPLSAQDKADPVCAAEIQCTNCKPTANLNDVLYLNFFSTVSQPGNCLAAGIRVSAAFYDAENNLICSGVIGENFTTQRENILSFNVEVQPLNVVEFIRLRAPLTPPAKRLFCMNIDGNAEVSPSEIAKASSFRLRVTVLPRFGGVATAECRMNLTGSR